MSFTSPTTVADLCAHVLRALKGPVREVRAVLAEDIDDAVTELTVSSITGLNEGSMVGVGAELMYVTGTTGSSIVVLRGSEGTDPAAHTAGSIVEVDWRWFTAETLVELVDEIRSWPPSIYRVETTEATIGSGDTAVAVTVPGFRHLLAVRRSVTGNDRMISEPAGVYRVDVGLPSDLYPTGAALYLPSTRLGSGRALIEYAADLVTDRVTLTTPLTGIGLSRSLFDAAKFGAMSRLVMRDEIARTGTAAQPEPRQADDVPVSATMRAGLAYRQIADKRLAEEAKRLLHMHPWRFG